MKLKLISLAVAGLVFNLSAAAITSPTAQGNYTVRVNGGTATTHGDFNKIIKKPTIAEIQFGNFVQDNFEIFGEISRYSAKGKRKFINGNFNGDFLDVGFDNIKATGFYVGGRYYIPTGSNFIPYVGAKAGFIHNSAVKAKVSGQVTQFDTEEEELVVNRFNRGIDVFKADNKLSAGVLAGFDYHITPNVSIGAGVEHIVSGKRKFNDEAGSHSSFTRYTPVFASVKYTFDI